MPERMTEVGDEIALSECADMGLAAGRSIEVSSKARTSSGNVRYLRPAPHSCPSAVAPIADAPRSEYNGAMDDAELPLWTMAQHLAAGSTAITQIEADRMHVGPEPVCHHFYETAPVHATEVSVKVAYGHLVPLFASAGLVFLPDRLEAWETVKPQTDWLQKRVPAILETAKTGGLVYQGWTWEPIDRQPIGATDIQIINNRTI